ncbi:MAG: hypothetical protein PVF87_00305 [Acidimicrobiia bacterium]|jgi:hypothetical protein
MAGTKSKGLVWTMAALVVVLLLGPSEAQPASALVDGDRIVYTRGCDEGPDGLDMELLDPSGPTTMATKTGGEGASISADGTRIAVAGYDGISVTDPDGTGPKLLPGTGQARFPVWSPDGTKIAFSRSGQLFIVGYQPYTAPAPLTAPGTLGTTRLDWSPDGSTLLWSNPQSKIVTVSVNGGSQTEVGTGTNAYYSADGTWIAFTSTSTGNLATMNADGSNIFVSLQPGTVGGLFGERAAFRDRHMVDGDLVDYVGSYSFATNTATTLIDGDPICDTNFYVWDWGLLKLPTFRDTAYDDLFFDDIEWLIARNITKGCNPPINDLFCGSDHVTRGQIAAFLSRGLSLPAGPANVFIDDDGSTFEDDIDRLAAAGITKGCNPPINDRFCPSQYVRRGEIAAFLVRALGYTDTGGGDLFNDDDTSIFEADIDRLATAGVTYGCNPPINDRFCPDDFVTRDQMAALLHRALDDYPLDNRS